MHKLHVGRERRKSLRAICVTIISLDEQFGGNEHIELESKHGFLHGLLLRSHFTFLEEYVSY